MRNKLATHRIDDILDAFALDYLDNKTAAKCLFGRHRVGEKQEALGTGWTEDGDEPCGVRK